ncbi:1-deoxy-D-xylulose-5-phosphate synthase N-terminal domain-containing protein [Pantoea ananatis]
MLTGRRDRIGSIRQRTVCIRFPGGESEYDVLSVGHSSTSISAGLGMGAAAEREGEAAARPALSVMVPLLRAWRLKP